MKITKISTHVINMPMKLRGDVPHVGGQARTALEMLLVRIDTDEGVTGWGEGFGHRIWSATRVASAAFRKCVGSSISLQLPAFVSCRIRRTSAPACSRRFTCAPHKPVKSGSSVGIDPDPEVLKQFAVQ